MLGVEKLLGLEVPLPRPVYPRACSTKSTRILNHLLNIPAYAMDVGAITPFLWVFEQRELLMEFYERVSGAPPPCGLLPARRRASGFAGWSPR